MPGTAQPEIGPVHRIPSLDGFRALAIAIVCFSHITMAYGATHPGSYQRFTQIGELGVRVFFVLSGFLITSLLLREVETTGKINLLKFYYRRTLRIFPAYYAFILITVAIGALGLINFHYGNPWPALTYTGDFLNTGTVAFGHTWSLAVEEQFYLLWPAALLLAGRRRALGIIAAVILAAPLWRIALFALFFRHNVGAGFGYRFDTQADALAMGCALAFLRPGLHQRALYQRILESRAIVLLPLGVLLLDEALTGFKLIFVARILCGYTLMNLGIALSLDRWMTHPKDAFGRFLNSRPLVTAGVLSYSVYIWQEVFLFPTAKGWFTHLPWNVGVVVAAAVASYYLVERPFLIARKRWERVLFGRSPQEGRAGGPVEPSMMVAAE